MFKSSAIRRSAIPSKIWRSKLSPACSSQNHPTKKLTLPPVEDKFRNKRRCGFSSTNAASICFDRSFRLVDPRSIEQRDSMRRPPNLVPLGVRRSSPAFQSGAGCIPSVSQTSDRSRLGCVMWRDSFVCWRFMNETVCCGKQKRRHRCLRYLFCNQPRPYPSRPAACASRV